MRAVVGKAVAELDVAANLNDVLAQAVHALEIDEADLSPPAPVDEEVDEEQSTPDAPGPDEPEAS